MIFFFEINPMQGTKAGTLRLVDSIRLIDATPQAVASLTSHDHTYCMFGIAVHDRVMFLIPPTVHHTKRIQPKPVLEDRAMNEVPNSAPKYEPKDAERVAPNRQARRQKVRLPAPHSEPKYEPTDAERAAFPKASAGQRAEPPAPRLNEARPGDADRGMTEVPNSEPKYDTTDAASQLPPRFRKPNRRMPSVQRSIGKRSDRRSGLLHRASSWWPTTEGLGSSRIIRTVSSVMRFLKRHSELQMMIVIRAC